MSSSSRIQRDELADVADPKKRAWLARIPTSPVPTYGFVADVSRLGMARLTDGDPYEALTGENRAKYSMKRAKR